MRSQLVLMTMLAAVSAAGLGPRDANAQSRQIVYNHVSADTADLDKKVTKVYGKKYSVRAIPEDDQTYVDPKHLEGRLPRGVLDPSGNPIKGHILVFYLIMLDGTVKDPIIIESTDQRLNTPVIEALRGAKFRPATWKGKKIATVAGQSIHFE